MEAQTVKPQAEPEAEVEAQTVNPQPEPEAEVVTALDSTTELTPLVGETLSFVESKLNERWVSKADKIEINDAIAKLDKSQTEELLAAYKAKHEGQTLYDKVDSIEQIPRYFKELKLRAEGKKACLLYTSDAADE